MNALRVALTSDEHFNTYGLRKITEHEKEALLLHNLSQILEEVRSRFPITIKVFPIVSSVFDLYLGTLVASEHLFLNLMKNVIKFNFQKLEWYQKDVVWTHYFEIRCIRMTWN